MVRKQVFCLSLVLLALALLLSGCGGPEGEAYKAYQQAYDQLFAEDSYSLERSASLHLVDTAGEETDNTGEYAWEVAKNGDEYQTVGHGRLVDAYDFETNLFYAFFKGVFYQYNPLNPGQNYSVKQEADFTRNTTLEGILDLSAIDILDQRAEETAEGGLKLTFVLDKTSYGLEELGAVTALLTEDPVYTAVLDPEGNFLEVEGGYEADIAGVGQQTSKYTVRFLQHGDLTLQLPDLAGIRFISLDPENDEDQPVVDAILEDIGK